MALWLGIDDGTDEGLGEKSSDGEPFDPGAVRGDPGRIHQEGMTARVAVETARESVAALVGARSREVVFTSGATESIGAATWGALERGASDGRRGVVLAAVEHSAVRQWAERGDARVVGVDFRGRIDPDELMAAVNDSTALVHIQWANHEVGTIQPVAEVVASCRDRGVLVHVDAAMAAGQLPIDFVGLGIDLMSISGHKFGAPTGTGALVVRRGLRIPPLLVGGDQERARRAGLENVVGAIGFGAAASEALGSLDAESARSTSLTDACGPGRERPTASPCSEIRITGSPTSSAWDSEVSSPSRC